MKSQLTSQKVINFSSLLYWFLRWLFMSKKLTIRKYHNFKKIKFGLKKQKNNEEQLGSMKKNTYVPPFGIFQEL